MPKATHAQPTLNDGTQALQLQHDIMGMVVHDLGSIAGALSVRAALPAPVDTAAHERQQAAMQELSRQVRSAMQLLELARGTVTRRRGDVPAAAIQPPTIPGDVWLDQLQMLARAVLPRHVPFVARNAHSESRWLFDVPDAAVLTRVVHAAWHGLLATCRADSVPRTVELVADVAVCTMTAEVATEDFMDGEDSWQRFSEREAESAGYAVRWWEPPSAAAPDGQQLHGHTLLTWSCARAPGAA